MLDSTPTRDKKARIFDRSDLDWYVEPCWVTEALLSVERFVSTIWDPACGQGNIVKTCHAAGYDAIGTDIVDRTDFEWWFDGAHNFLGAEPAPLVAANILTNPPFFRANGTEAFIRKALSIATGKVAVFADIKFLAGAARAKGLFSEHPPHRAWIMAKRPSCPPGAYLAAGNKAGGGTADWIWLVWSMTDPPAVRSELGWLVPNKELPNAG